MKGSPPQVRGKPCAVRGADRASGITPAGAGKTSHIAFYVGKTQDHPRRCGENRYSPPHSVPPAGSPPQVRGKLLQTSSLIVKNGITPAGAGKTRLQRRINMTNEDHPRRCGENVFVYALRRVSAGSPPQVRGKHAVLRPEFFEIRITPAGAGKTKYTILNVIVFKDHPRRCGENRLRETYPRAIEGSPPQVRGKPQSRIVFAK